MSYSFIYSKRFERGLVRGEKRGFKIFSSQVDKATKTIPDTDFQEALVDST